MGLFSGLTKSLGGLVKTGLGAAATFYGGPIGGAVAGALLNGGGQGGGGGSVGGGVPGGGGGQSSFNNVDSRSVSNTRANSFNNTDAFSNSNQGSNSFNNSNSFANGSTLQNQFGQNAGLFSSSFNPITGQIESQGNNPYTNYLTNQGFAGQGFFNNQALNSGNASIAGQLGGQFLGGLDPNQQFTSPLDIAQQQFDQLNPLLQEQFDIQNQNQESRLFAQGRLGSTGGIAEQKSTQGLQENARRALLAQSFGLGLQGQQQDAALQRQQFNLGVGLSGLDPSLRGQFAGIGGQFGQVPLSLQDANIQALLAGGQIAGASTLSNSGSIGRGGSNSFGNSQSGSVGRGGSNSFGNSQSSNIGRGGSSSFGNSISNSTTRSQNSPVGIDPIQQFNNGMLTDNLNGIADQVRGLFNNNNGRFAPNNPHPIFGDNNGRGAN